MASISWDAWGDEGDWRDDTANAVATITLDKMLYDAGFLCGSDVQLAIASGGAVTVTFYTKTSAHRGIGEVVQKLRDVGCIKYFFYDEKTGHMSY